MTTDANSIEAIFGEPIHVYTRQQAIDDGVLVDVTEWASAEKGFHGGFRCSVAMTRELWLDVENIPPSKQGWQDVRGRAHDVLWMASLAFRRMMRTRDTGPVLYRMTLHVGRRSNYTVKIVVGHDENGELTVTLMQPNQD